MSDAIRTVIVDDEPHARGRIADFLADEADIQVVGEAGNGTDAIRTIERLKPALVFLDVQMPEFDGFEVLRRLDPARLPRVIFVTAHDEYAVRAFEVHALDYLLKPFDRDRFQEALDRARRAMNGRGDEVEARLRALVERLAPERPAWLERIPVRFEGSIRILDVREVEYITAEANYARLHTADRTYLVRETMNRLETRLDPSRFLRVHRSVIIRLDRVRELQPLFHGEYLIRLHSGAKLTSGRTYRDRVQRALGID